MKGLKGIEWLDGNESFGGLDALPQEKKMLQRGTGVIAIAEMPPATNCT